MVGMTVSVAVEEAITDESFLNSFDLPVSKPEGLFIMCTLAENRSPDNPSTENRLPDNRSQTKKLLKKETNKKETIFISILFLLLSVQRETANGIYCPLQAPPV